MPDRDPEVIVIPAAAVAVRYSVYVPIEPLPDEDYDDLSLQLVVNAPTVPRVGEMLNFDGPGGRHLALTVTEVQHNFGCGPTSRIPNVYVTAELGNSPIDHRVARELLELVTFKRWLDAFPTLELPAHLRAAYELEMRTRNGSA